jgi:hypothetical protein
MVPVSVTKANNAIPKAKSDGTFDSTWGFGGGGSSSPVWCKAWSAASYGTTSSGVPFNLSYDTRDSNCDASITIDGTDATKIDVANAGLYRVYCKFGGGSFSGLNNVIFSILVNGTQVEYNQDGAFQFRVGPPFVYEGHLGAASQVQCQLTNTSAGSPTVDNGQVRTWVIVEAIH